MKKILPVIVALMVWFAAGSVLAERNHFRTFTVVEVTETAIIMQSTTGETVAIDKSRRSELQVGDRVSYEPARKWLGPTLPPGASEPAGGK